MTKIRVRRKGQITLPMELRLKYKIDAGTLLEVQELPEGMLLKPVGQLEPGRTVGVKQYHEIIMELEETREKWR